jgi:hypothetical protein
VSVFFQYEWVAGLKGDHLAVKAALKDLFHLLRIRLARVVVPVHGPARALVLITFLTTPVFACLNQHLIETV